MIGNLHSNQLRKLNSYDCVAEIEDDGMDEGRFFIHLEEGYEYPAPYYGQKTKSFSSFNDAKYWVSRVIELK